MENLLVLLNKISQVSPLGVFSQEVIVVQNAGMQHWLNLSLAKQRGISINTRYVLPAQYLWKLIRTLASDDATLDQAPYAREVLSWRIYALLATKTVIKDSDFSQATQYWHQQKEDLSSQNPTMQASTGDDLLSDNSSSLKRYQLAEQLADLFEQYLIFRPEWLDAWQQGNFNNLAKEATVQSEQEHEQEKWQGKLWQLLTQQQPYNPVSLINNAIANIAQHKSSLPKRLYFFGLNTMAPMWLNLINALSEHIDVHFFHLNPCFAYWGDIVSEKEMHNRLKKWSQGYDNPEIYVGNPLLANLGQQGREFIALLQDYSTVNIDVFEQAGSNSKPDDELDKVTVLAQLQNDILTLTDAREAQKVVSQHHDDSIVITSCHSALREVQGLHDYLLHQFNNDSSLTPKDVLVMCPQIENYAPYVNAVFARGWQDIDDTVPPLPCSIADRSAKDSDVLIATFSELLTLPDSRFQISQLLSFLRLPAMAHKFAIPLESLDKITVWLEKATIHWGIDLAHKQQLLANKNANNSFTWQQGLSRLLRGFAYADSDVIYQDQLLLGNVEGDDALLLGQLMLVIEQLQYFALQLKTARTAQQWQVFLLAQLEQLFVRNFSDVAKTNIANTLSTTNTTSTTKNVNSQLNQNNETSFAIIEQAIAELVEHCQQAHFNEKISLDIISEFLNHHFSQPETGRQFMVGQVTFCSMLPMRSIPFKIIAVLGLNDGEFPRQRQPLGFDLMSLSKSRLGDRSRRGDDRYLFLEALISARKSLYLSYQGRNIKNNSDRQPSLVLKELMEYLSLGYGWQCGEDSTDDIRQLPMQAFSEQNYQGKWASFDANWLALARQIPVISTHNEANLDRTTLDKTTHKSNADMDISTELAPLTLTIDDLVRFYQHPAKSFAQQQLNIYFDQKNTVLSDSEPFSADYLQTYLLRQALLNNYLTAEQAESTTEQVIERAHLSGKFPDLPTTATSFTQWQEDSQLFSQTIIEQHADNPEVIDCQLKLTINVDDKPTALILSTPLPFKNNQLVFYRSSTAKPKDLFTLYLHQLMVQVWQLQQLDNSDLNTPQDHGEGNKINGINSSRGFYFNTKGKIVNQYIVDNIVDAKVQLQNIINYYYVGQQQALLLNGDLAAEFFKTTRGKPIEMTQESFEKYWLGSEGSNNYASAGYVVKSFGEDDYIHYFWPDCPELSDHQTSITLIYQNMYQALQSVKAPKKKGAKK